VTGSGELEKVGGAMQCGGRKAASMKLKERNQPNGAAGKVFIRVGTLELRPPQLQPPPAVRPLSSGQCSQSTVWCSSRLG